MPTSSSAPWLSDDEDLSWILPLADELCSSASDITEATLSSPSSSYAASSLCIPPSPVSSPLDSPSSSVDSELPLPRDSTSHGSSGNSATTSRPTTTLSRAKKTQRNATARAPRLANSLARTKHEIRTLRDQTRELEGVLQRLAEAPSRSQSPIKCNESALYSAETMATARQWKQTACHERELLKRALRENQKLRLRMLDQRGLVKILQHMLLDRAVESVVRRYWRGLTVSESMESEYYRIRGAYLWRSVQVLSEKLLSPRVGAALSPDDCVVMTNLIADLNRMHLSLSDAPFVRQAKSAPDGGSYFSAHVRRDTGTGSVQLDVASCEEVPFKKAEVDSAVSKSFSQSTPGYRRYDPRVRFLSLLLLFWVPTQNTRST